MESTSTICTTSNGGCHTYGFFLCVCRNKFVGLPSGIASLEWDPQEDPFLPQPISSTDLAGKQAARDTFQIPRESVVVSPPPFKPLRYGFPRCLYLVRGVVAGRVCAAFPLFRRCGDCTEGYGGGQAGRGSLSVPGVTRGCQAAGSHGEFRGEENMILGVVDTFGS